MNNGKLLHNVFLALCLSASIDCLAAPLAEKPEKYFEACRAVAEASNLGRLGELAVSLADFSRLDINNDGELEKVQVANEGAMHVEGLEVYGMDGKAITFDHSAEDDWENDSLRWVMDQLPIRYGGQVYILGKTDDYLNYLSWVDKNNLEKVVCQFAHREELVETLLASTNDRLCQAAIKRKLSYVAYDKLHALTYVQAQEDGFTETMPGKFAALIDINNDGKVEAVVPLELASGRGRGCSAGHLGVLNRVRNKLDMKLTGLLPEPECGVAQTPFLFEGQVYIEKYGFPSNTHQVIQLTKGKLESVCKYDVRKVNYVLGEYERILANAESANADPWAYALNMPGTGGLQVLLDAKHDPRYTVRGNGFGTVIHEAIRAKQYDKLEFLLKKGVDPNVVLNNDPTSMPPLFFAIWQQSVDAVRLLVEYGANINQIYLAQTAVQEVNFYIHSEPLRSEMLKLLSKKGKQ